LSERLFGLELGRFVLTLGESHILELERDFLFVKHHGNTFGASGDRGAVEYQDHSGWDEVEKSRGLMGLYLG